MPNTYVALATETLSSNATTVTFSSIPATYTDLVVVCVPAAQDAEYNALIVRFNNDSSTLYSYTFLRGNGSTASSSRSSNDTRIYLGQFALNSVVGDQNFIVQVQNYSNTTTNKTVLVRSNRASSSLEATVGLYRSTSAINRIDIETSAGSLNQLKAGSTFSLYGIANADQGAAKATGGIITEDSQYWYHTFGASGAFIPKQSLTCDVLVVAGGGGGCQGGGGSGGLRSTVGATGGGGSLETALSLSATSYAVTVGAGGTAGTNTSTTGATSGSNSVFSSITSTGGGRGGIFGNPGEAGQTGGSGGGGGGADTGSSAGSGGARTASPVQGFAGGNGVASNSTNGGGGGGGAGALGGNATIGSNGGAGGIGALITALAIPTGTGVDSGYYGGGGSGGCSIVTTGGLGGGGAGGAANGNGTSAIVNTGGGGGGGGNTSGNRAGGNGGSGIVIIRYAK